MKYLILYSALSIGTVLYFAVYDLIGHWRRTAKAHHLDRVAADRAEAYKALLAETLRRLGEITRDFWLYDVSTRLYYCPARKLSIPAEFIVGASYKELIDVVTDYTDRSHHSA